MKTNTTMGIFGDVTQNADSNNDVNLGEHRTCVIGLITLFCVIRNGKLFPISLPCVTSYINEMQKHNKYQIYRVHIKLHQSSPPSP